jgi:hypothetical protein
MYLRNDGKFPQMYWNPKNKYPEHNDKWLLIDIDERTYLLYLVYEWIKEN